MGGAAAAIPYAEFLKILGILDSKEAREAYEVFKILLEKIDRLRKRDWKIERFIREDLQIDELMNEQKFVKTTLKIREDFFEGKTSGLS